MSNYIITKVKYYNNKKRMYLIDKMCFYSIYEVSFTRFGDVKNIHVNLDRRTGFVKGYALIEFEQYDDALSAIKGLNGKQLLGQTINVSWAFSKK